MAERIVAPLTRRSVMAAGLSAAAATIASTLARPAPTRATNNGSVLLGNSAVGTMDGIGINEATSTTRVVTTSGTGLAGESRSATGVVYGLYGRSDSSAGIAVRGVVTSPTGVVVGVRGDTVSTVGRGVVGRADSTSGFTYGVHGYAASPDGRGVYGEAAAAVGSTIGVFGAASSPFGIGVFGLSAKSSGPTVGVAGSSYSHQGIAVRGVAWSSVGATVGVLGEAASADGAGVLGFVGQHDEVPTPPPNTGVYGHAALGSGSRGVHGRSASGRGVYGQATSGQGIRGYATTGTAGYFASAKPAALYIGVALRAIGRVKLDSCAGVATVVSGAKTVVVSPGFDLVETSAVTATLLGSAGGTTTVHRVAIDTTANSFTIVLTANASADVKVAWHVFG